MPDQLTNNPEALRLFFTEDIFLVKAPIPSALTPILSAEASSSSREVLTAPAQSPITSTETPITSLEAPNLSAKAEATSTQASSTSAKDQEASVQEGVNLPATAAKTPGTDIESFKYVGANERNILILVYDTVHPVSSIAGRQLLGMILKSIKLDRNDCALLNYASCDGTDFNKLQTFFQPQYIFAFGLTPAQLGLPETASNSIITHNGTNLIFSSDLDALSEDPATKKQLWTSLQLINLK